MSRPGTARLKVNPPLGRMPTLQFLRPSEIRVDPAYQRSLEAEASKSLIRRMAQHWNWDLCQPLVIARRQDLTERFFVIDGQHRLAAAILRRDIDQLPCVIVTYESAADEAASFVHLNQQRRPLTKLDLFRAAVASEDPQATAIAAAMAEAGLSLAPHMNWVRWKPGMVSNIGGIERAWTRDGETVASRALDAMGQAFRGQVLRYCGTLFRAIAQVCADEIKASGAFKGERFDRFVALLQRRSQGEWMAEIKRFFSDGDALFLMEAAAGLLRQEWRRETAPRSTATASMPRVVGPRSGGDASEAKRQGFGLGASDWKGDAEWSWCEQCDKRRTRVQVASCSSRFCKLKAAA